MKVKVYDLAHLIEQYTGIHLDGVSEENAIIIGPEKYIIVDTDGIHTIHKNNEPLELTNPVNGDIVKLSLEDITVRGVPVNEVELGTFVRAFGSRLESNYQILLKSIREIGLNSNNYPRNPA